MEIPRIYERMVVTVTNSNELQDHILIHLDYRFICAIPWSGSYFLVFEKERV